MVTGPLFHFLVQLTVELLRLEHAFFKDFDALFHIIGPAFEHRSFLLRLIVDEIFLLYDLRKGHLAFKVATDILNYLLKLRLVLRLWIIFLTQGRDGHRILIHRNVAQIRSQYLLGYSHSILHDLAVALHTLLRQ